LDDKLQPTTLFEDDQEIEDNNITGESYPLEAEDRRKSILTKKSQSFNDFPAGSCCIAGTDRYFLWYYVFDKCF